MCLVLFMNRLHGQVCSTWSTLMKCRVVTWLRLCYSGDCTVDNKHADLNPWQRYDISQKTVGLQEELLHSVLAANCPKAPLQQPEASRMQNDLLCYLFSSDASCITQRKWNTKGTLTECRWNPASDRKSSFSATIASFAWSLLAFADS